LLYRKLRIASQGMSSLDRYYVCIWWSDEDGVFVASMPELPGCMADGQTQTEALANLREVAGIWIETAQQLDRAVPQPSTAPASYRHTKASA
jgi:predicted RNase H-like HicB family nuclease